MQKKAMLKVPNGKLLKIAVEIEGNVLVSVQFTGDFFAYPEEDITHLENLLAYHPLEEDLLRYTITSFVEQNNIQLFGITPDYFTEGILLCAKQEESEKNGDVS